jgi:LPXTG-motif cell wall-anchored protein
MTFRTRNLARVGASALLAVGALAAAGAPALAAPGDTDLQLKANGSTIAATASGKEGDISLINHGPNDAVGIKVVFDLTNLAADKVEFGVFGQNESAEGCQPEPGQQTFYCGVEPDLIKADSDIDFGYTLIRKPGATGAAGSITISVEHAGKDAKPGNNSQTVNVAVGESGVDLSVFASDVYALDEAGEVTDTPLAPGQSAPVIVNMINFGDVTARNLTALARVPAGATFDQKAVEQNPDQFPACVFSSDSRTAACALAGLTLVPRDEDTTVGDEFISGVSFMLPVTVSPKAKANVNLTGGLVAGDGEALEGPSIAAKRKAKLPVGVKELPVGVDVDPSDNSDEFTIFVGEGAPDPGNGGGGGGGGLPVTGAQAGLIGGIGGGAVIVGAALFFLSRRRRVVLVTPGDEKPPTV